MSTQFPLIKKLGLEIKQMLYVVRYDENLHPMVPAEDLEKVLSEAVRCWGYYTPKDGQRVFAPQTEKQYPVDTHTALLIAIEEIPKKECEHEPRHSGTIGGGGILWEDRCAKCGVELKAKWEAK